MQGRDEVNRKHERLRALLAGHDAPALLLTQTRNLAWFSAGADASIPVDSDAGVWNALVTPARRDIVTNNIELTRLRAEDRLEDLGFGYQEYAWHGAAPQLPPGSLVDTQPEVAAALLQLRLVLDAGEQERCRRLGEETAAALEEAIRAARPGDSELEIAARLDAACRRRGGLAVVNLVASDERIARFRHPLATQKRMQRLVMIVVCNRKWGLVLSATRLAQVGPLPPELRAKAQTVAQIDAAAMLATRPGRSHAAVFRDIQDAYAAQGEAGQWRYHHQGGTAGYNAREIIVTPGEESPVRAGSLYAWNPSIVGCKSEDTILVGDEGFEIITAAGPDWPMIRVEQAGQSVSRPGILEL
ncbi:MAG: M24 family metallopeptidase [Anaerolineaceae bacterium]|nr:M24 family metallopeptidase [Anaerolineaceae bacterium]